MYEKSKVTRWRRLASVAAALLLAPLLILLSPASPAHAAPEGSNNIANSAFADKALSYVGRWGGDACRDAGMLDNGNTGTTVGGYGAGQCKTFLNCIAKMLINKNLGGGYHQPYLNAGAVMIGSVNDLVKGDIIQIGEGVHTFIIVHRVSGSTFRVVDSNSQWNEMVRTYDRNVVVDGGTNRAYRLGKVSTGGVDTGAYVGKVVSWQNTNGQPNPSWIVLQNGHRRWIPDVATFNCMIGIGFQHVGFQSATVLSALPDDTGQHASCPVRPPGARDTMYAGQGLYRGQSMSSSDGRFVLIMQGDGNLVEYGPNGRVVWATNRNGGFTILQGDCNFVEYTMWGSPVWASNVGGSNCRLVLQNDGNLVVYGNGGRGGGVIWATDRH